MTERHGDRPDHDVSGPAPTLTSNARSDVWVLRAGAQANATERPATEPAPTILASIDNGDTRWVLRSGSTVAGGPLAITEQEALILQSFDPDYPVQGTRSKRFEQIGNAIPPLLARHVLASVLPEATA